MLWARFIWFFLIYSNGHNFLLQGQVIVKLENYESAHKITYINEKKIGVQKNDQKCPGVNNTDFFLVL